MCDRTRVGFRPLRRSTSSADIGRYGSGEHAAWIDQGVYLLVRFAHAALSALRGTAAPLTLTLRSVDDGGFETVETLVLRREGVDAQGRDLWTLRPGESRRSTRAEAR